MNGKATLSGALTITAIDRDTRATAVTQTGGVGAVSVTIVRPTANARGSTSAYLGPSADVHASSLTVSATATDRSSALANMVGVGVVSGAGAVVRGLTGHNTSAYTAVGGRATLTGGASFTATLTNTALASGSSIGVGAISGSSVDVKAEAGGTTEASVAGTLNATTLSLTAHSTNIATPTSSGVSVGLGSFTVSTTNAVVSAATNALLRSGANVTLTGAATLEATSTSRPTVHTDGVSVGGVTGAAQYVTTNLGGSTTAGSTTGATLHAPSLSATATSTNDTSAAMSFVGVSLVGGSGTQLTTNVTQQTSALIGGNITINGPITLAATSSTHSVAANDNVNLTVAASVTIVDVHSQLAGTTSAGVADDGSVAASSLTATANGDAVSSATTRFVGFSLGASGTLSRTTAELTQNVDIDLKLAQVDKLSAPSAGAELQGARLLD